MIGWKVERVEDITLERRNRLAHMYVLSPYVWASDGGFNILVRGVPRRDDEPRLKMAELWRGRSADGLRFVMEAAPLVWPGPGLEDLDGCEDPTVVVHGGQTRIWYTGFNQSQSVGRLLMARGPDLDGIAKAGVVFDSAAPFENPKEAELVRRPDGSFRIYVEYAHDEASLVGQADADDLDGPWGPLTPASLQPRPDAWDSWHLSPGPVLDAETDAPVMIYNGATREGRWRIGAATFDRDFTTVVDRCEQPLIVPKDVKEGASDITFAASLVQEGDVAHLYFSQSDQDLMRATLVRA